MPKCACGRTNDEIGFLAEGLAIVGGLKAGIEGVKAIRSAIAPQTRRVRSAKDPAAVRSSAGPANPNSLVTFEGKTVTVNWVVTELARSTATLESVNKKMSALQSKLTATYRKNSRLTRKVDKLEDQRIVIGAGTSILGLLIGFYAGGRNATNKLTSKK
jgi:hypothetical protein